MNKFIVGLFLLAAGVVVGWYFLESESPSKSMPPGQETSKQEVQENVQEQVELDASSSSEVVEKGGVAARVVVAYTDTGFSPSPVKVKQGEIVTFVNESSKALWVASGEHPTHQLLPGFDQLTSVVKNGTYEYTFTKVGTWKYHNHMSAADIGYVQVAE